ncbi:hypothetical protein [Alkalicoccus chagannorensis]|uniref:hypothetical protein n=1 Tax=Alkalicoccus chagannorensis TaxID=427072 RepID=UPI0003F4EBB6|nr:hypothetical protein [Alkalicoccus chagannorensis]
MLRVFAIGRLERQRSVEVGHVASIPVLSEEKPGTIYHRRKTDVEAVVGFLKSPACR